MFQSKKGGLQIKIDNHNTNSPNYHDGSKQNQQQVNNNGNNGSNGYGVGNGDINISTSKTFSLTNSGTFKEGDLLINKKGLFIKGESPKNSPLNFDRKRPSSQRNSNFNNQSNNNNNNVTNTSTTNNYQNNGNNGQIVNGNTSNDSQQPNFMPSYDNLLSLELKDLKIIRILGRGEGGVVKLAYHESSNTSIALKVIPLDVQENIRKQIILELKTLHRTHCPYIVSFYDAFYTEGSIHIALEYMDGGSLADLMKSAGGPIPENVLSNLTHQVLQGLHYLHRQLHLIHRDIKPSNILINRQGHAKISDFGVSSQRQDTLSKAVTWVGTVVYMSPERISGQSYSYDSDIWSLGLTLLECALGYFPYSPPKSTTCTDNNYSNNNNMQNNNMNDGEVDSGIGFWTLMDTIVKTPVPALPQDKYSKEFCSFVTECLQKEPEERPSAFKLLNHPFIKKYQNEENVNEWILKHLK